MQKVGKVPRKPQKGGADEKKSPSRLYRINCLDSRLAAAL
eukprot:SAG25_NODE_1219_length_3579_cov_4.935632_1_plen_40_part_00